MNHAFHPHPHRPRPRRQRPLRPRRRAGLRRRRLARPRPGPARRRRRHAGGRRARRARRCAALADALARPAAPSVVVHGINPIYTRWEEEVLPAAHAGDGPRRALRRALHAARQRLQPRRGDAGAASTRRRRSGRPPPRARSASRSKTSSSGAAAAGRLRATVITAGDFFGAGSGSWLDQAIVKPIASGRLDYPGDPELVARLGLPARPGARVRRRRRARRRGAVRALHLRRPLGHRARLPRRRRARRGDARPRARRAAWRHGRMPWPLIRVVGIVVPLWRELARMSLPLAHAARARRSPARRPLPGPAGDAAGRGVARKPARPGPRLAPARASSRGPARRYPDDRNPSGGTEQCDWSPRATRPMRDGPRPCHPTWTATARSCWRSRRPSSAPIRRRSRSSRRLSAAR